MKLVDGFLLARSTGQPPWELGMELPRRRFGQAAVILSRYWELHQLTLSCPMLGGGE